MPPREKGAKACLQDWADTFSGPLCVKRFAQLRPIRAISQELRAVFSARQTLWRSRQSGANLSPPKFPGNRENNREFSRFYLPKTAPVLSKLHISLGKPFSNQNSSREFSRTYQGISFSYQGVCRESCCWVRGYETRDLLNQGRSRATRVGRRESQLLPLLDPVQGKVLTQFVKVQVSRLPTGEDPFNDIGGKEGAAEDLTNVNGLSVPASRASDRMSTTLDPPRG